MLMPKQEATIAISVPDLNQFGCPHCGYRSGSRLFSVGGTAIWQCGKCHQECHVLAEWLTHSVIGPNCPEVQKHPRQGIAKHGNPDISPGEGGEFFKSRGIGLDRCTCFICNTDKRDELGSTYLNNISAFVECREAGERVVAMFPNGARLDYREREPDRVQVKIGACDTHLPNLQKLDLLTRDGVITEMRIAESRT